MQNHIFCEEILADKEDLYLGVEIEGVYYLSETKKVTMKEKNFVIGKLGDRTGKIACKIPAELFTKEGMFNVRGCVMLYKNAPSLEVYSLKEEKNISDEVSQVTVAQLTKKESLDQMKDLRTFVDSLDQPYTALCLKVVNKETVGLLAGHPDKHFPYNGGLLYEAVALCQLAEGGSIKNLSHPDRNRVITSLVLASIGRIGVYSPLPEYTRNELTGGCRYFGHLLYAISSADVEDKQALIHNIRCLIIIIQLHQ